MGLLFCDGWEVAFADNDPGVWDLFEQSSSWRDIQHAQSGGRTGLCGKFVSQNGPRHYQLLTKSFESKPDEIWGLLAVYFHGGPSTAYNGDYWSILNFHDSNADELHLGIGIYEGNLSFCWTRRPSTLIAGPTNARVVPYKWYVLRFHVKIHDTNGIAWLEIDGEEAINFSGDTRNGGNGDIYNVKLGTATNEASGQDVWVDDFILRDDHLPSYGGVFAMIPGHPDGTHTDWTLSSGTAAWQVLDDDPPSMTDYVSIAGSLTGQKTTVNVEDLPLSELGTIEGVLIASYGELTSAGTAYYRNLILSGGSEGGGGTIFPQVLNPQIYTDIFDLDPNGNVQWTLASLGSLQIGVESLGTA
jgi:hypothetical protein